MKAFKKILALTLSVLLIASLGAFAFAEDGDTGLAGEGDGNPVHLVSYGKDHDGYEIVPVDEDGKVLDNPSFYVATYDPDVPGSGDFYFKIRLKDGYSFATGKTIDDENTSIRYYRTGLKPVPGTSVELFSEDGSLASLNRDGYHDVDRDSKGVYHIAKINCDITIDPVTINETQQNSLFYMLRYILRHLIRLIDEFVKVFKK